MDDDGEKEGDVDVDLYIYTLTFPWVCCIHGGTLNIGVVYNATTNDLID